MPLLPSIISWVTIKRLNQIDLFKKYAQDVQRDQLFHLIRRAKNTEWGKKFDYSSIGSIRDFQLRVPISAYENLEPWIERARKGEKNIIWPTDIKWFAKSSGTTAGKSKFIPVSNEALEECHFRGGKDTIVLYSSNFNSINPLKGKALAIGGSQQINQYNNEIYYGDLSAVLIKNLPHWANFIRTPDKSIALMDEWETKIEKMAQATIQENVTNISGVPSWTLVLIKRIFEITAKDNLKDVWPNLELFVHGGVSFVPYRDEYKKIIRGGMMNYMETYNASEGFFGIQDNPDNDSMLLMLDYGVFYEFIPMENFGKPNAKALIIDEVEVGVNYALIISTNGGLWRYLIGDTVQFTSKYPFRFKITGRTKFFINAFGEELIVENAEKALKKASDRTGATIREYTAAPVYMSENSKGKHQWLIEFITPPDNLEHFTDILDTTLKSVNSDYEAKRYKNMSLDVPEVIIAKNNLFYSWLKVKGKLGGQHKIPRLSNNRDHIDELLKMNN